MGRRPTVTRRLLPLALASLTLAGVAACGGGGGDGADEAAAKAALQTYLVDVVQDESTGACALVTDEVRAQIEQEATAYVAAKGLAAKEPDLTDHLGECPFTLRVLVHLRDPGLAARLSFVKVRDVTIDGDQATATITGGTGTPTLRRDDQGHWLVSSFYLGA